ncbi:MAG: hypothetical protein QW035_03360 [Candidatus Anstonellales archaeon]
MDKLKVGRKLLLLKNGFIEGNKEVLWACEIGEKEQALFEEVKDCFVPAKGFFKGEKNWFLGIIRDGIVFIPNELVKTAELEKLKESHRQRIAEGVVYNLARMHSKSIMLRNFSLANLLYGRDVVFLDPSKLARAMDSIGLVNEFLYAMKALIMSDIVGKGNAQEYISAYFLRMKEACRAWYIRKYKIRPKKESEIVREMYDSIIMFH